MAGSVPSAWPLLVLSLLWLFWPIPGTGTVRVQAPAQVHGLLGDSVTLPCHLQPLGPGMQVTQVTWMRQELAGQPSSLAVFHPARGPWYSDPGRLEFVAKSPDLLNASLVVSQLRVEDEANYTCQFATFPQGSSSNSTWLRVLVQPQNTAEPWMEPPSLFTSEPVPVARCMSTGGRPAAQITWSSYLNGTVNNSQIAGPLPGTFTVISFLTVVPSSQVDGKNITCRVDHESFKEPRVLPVNLTVFYPPEVSISGYDGKWYLNQPEANLTCNVRSNPEPTGYNWSTTNGSLPHSAVPQGAWLLIHPVDKSINTTFICSVTNDIGTGQGELAILVKDQSDSGNLHVILIVTVVFMALLAIPLEAWQPLG
ncbi:poliovirus receptor [Otolemur garnettii]|uniref:poliovirus receptor n=1 Tax=Otolemur garnettii TaxID=30611 RepID=UPI00064408F4|nr:poliovirus receptor [Otolemur garnettii]